MCKFPEKVQIDLHFHSEGLGLNSGLSAKLDVVIAMLDEVLRKEKTMSKEMDALVAQVKINTDVEKSMILLLQGLSTLIETNKADPVALQKMADELKVSAEESAQAVLANTPAE